MLVLRPIGEGQAGYYLRGPDTGRWTGTGCPRLGLDGEVGAAALTAVLAGRDPSGTLLRRRTVHRRPGFDLILAAPKSVSLLAAMSDANARLRVEQAHDQAVRSAFSYIERHATWTRRRGEPIPTRGLVAASFSHHSSAARDPHLHTHLVVPNLVQGSDGVWSALDSRSLYRHARAAGAIFQASLRHGLAERGFDLAWAGADIAGVPRAAIEACSQRHRQVIEEIASGSGGRRARVTAAGRTRATVGIPPAGWEVRVAAAGFDRTAAGALSRPAAGVRPPAVPAGAPARFAVEAALAQRHSRFERHDVIHAVAGLAVGGASGAVLERWADDFLAGAIALDHRTWTTAGLRSMEQGIADLAIRSGHPPSGLAGPAVVDGVLAQRPELTEAARAAVQRLATSGSPVELLGPGDLVGQAAVLDAARSAWESSGHRVAVVSQSKRGEARWEALAGMAPAPPRPRHATVLVVDGADRWPTAALHGLLADGHARCAKVVLIDGGTNPARHRPVSPAVETLRSRLDPIDCGQPGPLPGCGAVVRGGLDTAVAMVATGPAAMAQVVADWAEARAGPGPTATMVALGPEEADYLNRAARVRLQDSGRLRGPAVEVGARQYQAGDELRALRRDSRLGSVPGGTVGVVAAVDADRRRLVVRWPGREVPLTASQLAGAPLTHAYATTPAYLRRDATGPVLALGDTHLVAPRLTADVIVRVVTTGPARDPVDLLDAARKPLASLYQERDALALGPRRDELTSAIAWRENALGQAAETRPSRAVLESVGPRPESPNERQSWRQAATAIEAYRERWALPDRPLALRADSPDALRVIRSCRSVEHDRALSPGPAL